MILSKTIEQISSSFLEEAMNSPRLIEDMAAMEKYMTESYNGRIFVELLQNADDARSSKIKMFNQNGHLFFANNGRPFNESDILSISRSGASSKERGTSIGYRGIGFKSTTYLSNEILIFSDDTYFTFSKEICSKRLKTSIDKIPVVRIPFLLQDITTDISQCIENLIDEGFTSVFVFKNAKLNEFVDEVATISNNDFLFLRNILSGSISVLGLEKNIVMNRVMNSIGEIVSSQNNLQWLIVVKDKVKIAFKFDGDEIVPCNSDEAVYHCYLPTLDKISYPIKINGDFSTDPSRKHLTVDEITINVLNQIADVIFDLIKKVFDGKLDKTFSKILTIFSVNQSFSKSNLILRDAVKHRLISNKWLPLNSGVKISPAEYKLFPNWIEDSEKKFLRTTSKFVHSNSLPEDLFVTFNDIDLFIQQLSEAKYTTDDFIKVMEDADFVKSINSYTQGKIIGHIAKTAKYEQAINGKSRDLKNLLVSFDDKVIPISKTNKDIVDKKFIDSVKQNAMDNEIKWLSEKVEIDPDVFLNSEQKNANEILSENKSNCWQSSRATVAENNNILEAKKVPIVSRWRNAEQQCVEMEKSMGNDAKYVGSKNLGYDVESKTPDGKMRYIEVKLLSSENGTFSLTNNEYTTAHQFGNAYYICAVIQKDNEIKATYIQNPLLNIQLEKRVRQWEWLCESFDGEEFTFKCN